MDEIVDVDIAAKGLKLVYCVQCKKRHLKKNSRNFPEIMSFGDDKKTFTKKRMLYFCSKNCEIKYMINIHKTYGYDNDEILHHLSIDHGYMYSDVIKNLGD